jgi:MFS family permease
VSKGDLIAVIKGQEPLISPAAGRINRSTSNEAQIDTTKTKAYWLMAFCGLVGAIVQGGLIGPLVKLLGEKKMVVLGIFCVGLSLAFIPYCSSEQGLASLMIVLAFFAVSSGLYRAPTFGLISLNASSDEQGEIMGVTQSIGSLARIIGPPFALGLMDVSTELPYLICAVIAVLAAIPAAKYIVMPSMAEQDDTVNDS